MAKEKPQSLPDEKKEVRPDPDAVCDVCGRFGAYCFGERKLCQHCYAEGGSCCPEFGKDDLWTFEEEE